MVKVGGNLLYLLPYGIIMLLPTQSSAQAIEQQLWVAAREFAGQHQAEFSVPCGANVKDFIRAGVKNMLREGRVGDADLDEAEKNLQLLVEGMVRAPSGTQKRGPQKSGSPKQGFQGLTLREGSLVHAKRLCPLWPFA